MKNHWLIALNLITIVVLTDLICAFQTSLWMQVLGNFPPPVFWIPILTYVILHRPIWEGVFMTYVITFVLCAYTAEPFEHFLLANMISLVFVLLIKNRIYWSSPNYFMLMVATALLLHFVLIAMLSQFYDQNPLRNPELFHWMISYLLTLLISVPTYRMLKWFDRITQREESTDSIGSLV